MDTASPVPRSVVAYCAVRLCIVSNRDRNRGYMRFAVVVHGIIKAPVFVFSPEDYGAYEHRHAHPSAAARPLGAEQSILQILLLLVAV
ncbi:MAG: hypothetical protein JWR85_4007 [Marmoricola sp.]|nr:hypothetical protein [Marmoricola sp.]